MRLFEVQVGFRQIVCGGNAPSYSPSADSESRGLIAGRVLAPGDPQPAHRTVFVSGIFATLIQAWLELFSASLMAKSETVDPLTVAPLTASQSAVTIMALRSTAFFQKDLHVVVVPHVPVWRQSRFAAG